MQCVIGLLFFILTSGVLMDVTEEISTDNTAPLSLAEVERFIDCLATFESKFERVLSENVQKFASQMERLAENMKDSITQLFNKLDVMENQNGQNSDLYRNDTIDQIAMSDAIDTFSMDSEQRVKHLIRRAKRYQSDAEENVMQQIAMSLEMLEKAWLRSKGWNTFSLLCNVGMKVSELYFDAELFPVLYKFIGKEDIDEYDLGEEMQGSWIVFQRRFDGSVDFHRNWTEYRNGFGDPVGGEFWLGLEKLYAITGQCRSELLILGEDYAGRKMFTYWTNFRIASEEESYRIEELCEPCMGHGTNMILKEQEKFVTYDKVGDYTHWKANATIDGGWWFNRNEDYRLSTNTGS
ncbi:fibrinogen and fibronectin [Anopheles sinensis]|uniref:Fibrinogen C-terminal domain-containing protein n=1 Tax=Anopheles sinensis TaxID=74873 RepID=A0A084WEG7_ANOSI|nr:fibrinogen and fibronectin [Anopheles sinensis]